MSSRTGIHARGLQLLALSLMAVGGWQVSFAGYIWAKAWLAEVLIERAWQSTLQGEGAVRPWPWADTYPVARLEVPRLSITRLVLEGATGGSLAFGPGHVDGTALPGEADNSVLGGHRDTHFRFLEHLVPGDEVRVQRSDGAWSTYLVLGAKVVHKDQAEIPLETEFPTLTLITCYPFDAIVPGGSLRYVVIAVSLEADPGGGQVSVREAEPEV